LGRHFPAAEAAATIGELPELPSNALICGDAFGRLSASATGTEGQPEDRAISARQAVGENLLCGPGKRSPAVGAALIQRVKTSSLVNADWAML
jgi:hypothetical protein